MSTDEGVSFSLEINVEPALQNLRRVQTVLFRALQIFEKLAPEAIKQRIQLMQRAIMTANQLRLALIAVQAASGPLGWALAGIGVLTGLSTAGTLIEDIGWNLHRHQMG